MLRVVYRNGGPSVLGYCIKDLTRSNLSLHLPSAQATCCGMEWLATSANLQPGAVANITCHARALSSLPAGQSLCHCKSQQLQQNPNLCYELMNFTSLPSPAPNGTCAAGCPAGMRPYPTGTRLPGCFSLYHLTFYTPYESSCQGG